MMLRRLALAALLALLSTAASAQFATIAPTPQTSDNGDRIATTAWVNSFILSGFDRALSVQNSGDTNDCASGSGSYRAYNLTYNIPANFLINQRAIRVTAHYRLVTGATPTGLEFQIKLGGTVVGHYGPNTPTANVTQSQFVNQWIIQGTAAPSASSATEAALIGNSNGIGSLTVQSDTAQPVNLATNGTLAITLESKWASACTGTNTIKLSQFIVQAIN